MSARTNEVNTHPEQTPTESRHKTILRQEGVATGAGIGLASISPVLIGACTMVYEWPPIPFNLSLALFIVVCVAAVLNYRFAELREQREQHQEQSLAELERSCNDIKKAIKHGQRAHGDAIKELRIEVMSRDIRAGNLRGLG